MENSKPNQNERVLEYIREYGGITQFEATTRLGVSRLASRICDLRKRGHAITGKTVRVKNRYGESCNIKRYSLEEAET